MSTQDKETLPETAAPAKPMAKKKPVSKAKPVSTEMKKKKKGKGPGKYSQLVIDAIKTLSERNGSSLFKIYNEAKKVSWFDQEHGRVYLRYSIRALLQNDTLVQVKGLGANGSFKLNKNKFTTDTKKIAVTGKKTAKPTKKPTKKADEKNKSVSGVKKAGSKAKKTTKHKKEDKSPAAAAKKSKKAKQPKKTVKKTVKKA